MELEMYQLNLNWKNWIKTVSMELELYQLD